MKGSDDSIFRALPQHWAPTDDAQLVERCSKVRHVALDMDGTIYMGSHLFPYTKQFLSDLTAIGITYSFLTNNPTRSVDQYRNKLLSMGIDTSPEDIYTSSLATIDYLRYNHPYVKRLFILGTPGMIEEFTAAGYQICSDSASDVPEMLIVAFDTTLVYERLCRAAYWAAKGIPYIATNPDRVCPTDEPTVLVDCGSLCSCIEHATGRKPDTVIGKPNPEMLQCIMRRYSLRPEQVAMCGDRIYTDVATAHAANALGVLVLSGETSLETSLNADPRPFITLPTVADLIPFLTFR